MARKSDIKTCRYKQCRHESKSIDISKDEYVVDNRMYFHADCYKAKSTVDLKDENTKNDLQLIRTLWVDNISNTVVYSQLFHMLNELLKRGVDSDYLVFVMQYCIEHKLNLNYPNGFPYFVDKKEIKDAYAKKKSAANRYNINSFVAVEKEDSSPKFSVSRRPSGFQSILRGK